MNLASSEAMNTMPSATSSERPRRPSGTCVTSAALFSAVPVKRVSMPVSVGPGDGIHANSRLGDFEGHRFSDAFDGVLSADVDRGPGRALVPVGRGDVNDVAAPLGLHGAHFVLHAQDHAENVGLERRCKAFGGLVRDRADRTFGGGIVHGDIETAEPRNGLVDHGADVIFLADVGVDELGLRTERAQFLNERVAGLITPIGNDDLRALLGKGDGGGAPDAGESTGDPDYWVAHMLTLTIRSGLTGRAWSNGNSGSALETAD